MRQPAHGKHQPKDAKLAASMRDLEDRQVRLEASLQGLHDKLDILRVRQEAGAAAGILTCYCDLRPQARPLPAEVPAVPMECVPMECGADNVSLSKPCHAAQQQHQRSAHAWRRPEQEVSDSLFAGMPFTCLTTEPGQLDVCACRDPVPVASHVPWILCISGTVRSDGVNRRSCWQ
jgi:hypothetical protein